MIKKLLLLTLLSWSLNANAFFGSAINSWEVPENRPQTILISYYISVGTPGACFDWQSPAMKVFLVLSTSFISSCAIWTDVATCYVYITPTTDELTLGHETRHCFDHHFHNFLGI